MQQYNEGTTGAYCAACCSNTDVSGDTWTFTCPLISTAFAEFVNHFGWEFREYLKRAKFCDPPGPSVLYPYQRGTMTSTKGQCKHENVVLAPNLHSLLSWQILGMHFLRKIMARFNNSTIVH